MKTNVIYCGDCKDIIPEEIPSESIDLIYTDPPFFSGINYEKIWKNGAEDKAYQEYWKEGIHGFIRFMEGRLSLCKDVLKPTGSIYLHCDWHANAHLRLLMDKIFGERNFRNEIVWCYSGASSPGMKQFARKHDTIFWYSHGDKWTFNVDQVRLPYAKSSLNREGYIKTGFVENGICELNEKGKFPEDWWEIPFIRPNSHERLGYPTQKPEALLERIIKASSNPTDVVLDPMCGGGTTLAVAKELNRQFIGIDVSPIACELTLRRLNMEQEEMIIIPNCVSHLEKMSDKVFQRWVVKRLNGQVSPTMSVDKGIDGYTSFEMIPIQVKKSKGIGGPSIRQFAADTQIFGKKKGIFVALSFNEGAKKVIHEIYNKMGIEIELKTAEDLIK